MTTAEKTLRATRLVHFALLFAAAAYLVLPLAVSRPMSRTPPLGVILTMGAVGFSGIAGAIVLRARLVQPSAEALRANSQDLAALQRWRAGVIVSLVLCETTVLLGLALRFMGAPWSVCAVFYAPGTFLLLAWMPRLELIKT